MNEKIIYSLVEINSFVINFIKRRVNMNKKDNRDENLYKKDKLEKSKNVKVSRSDMEVGEDATKYGEFVSTYFAWLPLQKQKERANELDNITKGQKKSKNNEMMRKK